MDKNQNSSACNKKLDEDNYKKSKPLSKNCYNERKKKKQ